jgi:hypothetical protein
MPSHGIFTKHDEEEATPLAVVVGVLLEHDGD